MKVAGIYAIILPDDNDFLRWGRSGNIRFPLYTDHQFRFSCFGLLLLCVCSIDMHSRHVVLGRGLVADCHDCNSHCSGPSRRRKGPRRKEAQATIMSEDKSRVTTTSTSQGKFSRVCHESAFCIGAARSTGSTATISSTAVDRN